MKRKYKHYNLLISPEKTVVPQWKMQWPTHPFIKVVTFTAHAKEETRERTAMTPYFPVVILLI